MWLVLLFAQKSLWKLMCYQCAIGNALRHWLACILTAPIGMHGFPIERVLERSKLLTITLEPQIKIKWFKVENQVEK